MQFLLLKLLLGKSKSTICTWSTGSGTMSRFSSLAAATRLLITGKKIFFLHSAFQKGGACLTGVSYVQENIVLCRFPFWNLNCISWALTTVLCIVLGQTSPTYWLLSATLQIPIYYPTIFLLYSLTPHKEFEWHNKDGRRDLMRYPSRRDIITSYEFLVLFI